MCRGGAPPPTCRPSSEPGKRQREAPLTIKGVISSGGTELWANQRARKAAATVRSADGGNLRRLQGGRDGTMRASHPVMC